MPEIPAPIHRAVLRMAYPFARFFWRMTRPSVAGAYAVIRRDAHTPDEAWLFVTNTYKPGLTLPGGGIARGESPRDAAARETHEEVDLDLAPARFEAHADFELEYLHRLDHVHFFVADLAPGEALTPTADQREVGWAGFKRLCDIEPDELALPVRRYLEELVAVDRSS